MCFGWRGDEVGKCGVVHERALWKIVGEPLDSARRRSASHWQAHLLARLGGRRTSLLLDHLKHHGTIRRGR